MIDCPKCGSTKLECGATTAERVCESGHRFTVHGDKPVVPTQEYDDSFLEHAQKTTSQYDRTCRVLAADLLRRRAEVARLRDLINRDRTGLAEGLSKVRRAARSRYWIVEGRGSYEWDDEQYRRETGHALAEVIEIAEAALKASGDLADEAFHPDRKKIETEAARIADVIEELETFCRLATPGPWVADRTDAKNDWFDGLPEGSIPIESTGTCFALGVAVAASPHQNDARFIAAARQLVPQLISRLRELEELFFAEHDDPRRGLRGLLALLARERRRNKELAGAMKRLVAALPTDVDREKLRELAEGTNV